jgi:ABC-type antimicrobial peptide transport system permease subunit
MSLPNSFLTALRGMLSNKLRAALTTLGIVIGVASVIVMLALGNGARAAVESNFRNLGSDEIQIFEKLAIKNAKLQSVGTQLTYEDGLQMTEAVSSVDRVEMSLNGSARIRYNHNTVDVNFQGVTANALHTALISGQIQPAGWSTGKQLTSQDLIGEGRFFSYSEVLADAGICILSYQTAQDLFEGDDPIGEKVWVNRFPCMVVGVLAELEATDPQQRYQTSLNEGIYLPVGTAVTNLFDKTPSVTIQAYVKDEKQIDTVKLDISAYMRKRHNITQDDQGKYMDDFDFTTRNDVLGAQLQAAQTFSLLLAAMAVVSLVVGGIGIMNVMLVSVTERTREIGIRLAVGAQQTDIVIQFLLESVLISAAGGLFGIALGVFTIPLAAQLNQGVALLDPGSIPMAFSVALLTGIIFGLYPAARAARMSLIEALVYE